MPDSTTTLHDNPTGDEFRTLKDDGRRFQVLHLGVGSHRDGAIVSARQLGPGAELQRLVELNAIRELSASEVKDHEDTLKQVGSEENPLPVLKSSGEPTANVLNPPGPAKPKV